MVSVEAILFLRDKYGGVEWKDLGGSVAIGVAIESWSQEGGMVGS